MSYNAIILADSISPAGHRVTSLEVTYPRFILAEKNTHRMLSRGTASSRAIPVEERALQILANPFVPEAFGKNKSGMQSGEQLNEDDDAAARAVWLSLAESAVAGARQLAAIKVHKQHANRAMEPFSWITAIITATEWDNWDALRVSKLAQPEMYKIAGMMREVREASKPVLCTDGVWHLPYVRGVGDEPLREQEFAIQEQGFNPVKVCVGRCAAISYNRNSSHSDMQKDATRCDFLVTNGHMSPLEHALRPMSSLELKAFETCEWVWDVHLERFTRTDRKRYFLGNVEGWVQYRKQIPGEDVYRER